MREVVLVFQLQNQITCELEKTTARTIFLQFGGTQAHFSKGTILAGPVSEYVVCLALERSPNAPYPIKG
jgi:hypothetical protein